MRLTPVKAIIICIFCALTTVYAQGNNDGLYFYSHSKPTGKRTTLTLNNGSPVKVKDVFRMSFNMDLRGNESFFGNIFCIKTDDGKHIDAILSMPSEGVNRPGLVVEKKLHHVNCNVTGAENIKVGITLDTRNNKITYDYGGRRTTVAADLSHVSTATILFGMHRDDANYVDVAPINVRDICISYGGKDRYLWNLRQHKGNVCYDNISKAPATAINGHWILDDHVNWKTVFTYKSKDKIQVTFNPKDNVFYIVDNKSVRRYDPAANTTQVISVKGGYRAMMYSNYIGYNALDNDLYTYNVKDRLVSHFDFGTGRWSNGRFISDEPECFNHSWAMASDTVAYMFGGYGFYRYHNSLYCINPKTGDIRKLEYSPLISPRTGAATAIVGNKLYIFGGYGNDTGEQELPCRYYYDLTCIDLKTLKAETVWTFEGEQQGTSFQLASEMLYNSEDSTFYAATTYKSGRLIKISMSEPGWKVVTESLQGDFNFKDMTFNLYRSDKDGKLYVVINRRMNNLEHNVRICSINLPLQDDDLLQKKEDTQESCSPWLWALLLIVPAGGLLTYCIIRRRKRSRLDDATKTKYTLTTDTNAVAPTADNNVQNNPQADAPATLSSAGNPEATDVDGNGEEEEEGNGKEPVRYYNPTGGYISILGKFMVRDRNGEDITSLFTRRTRNLLLMLLLHSEKSSKGIEINQLDEALWQEMNEDSARNNRNVYMRKLRVLLEKVGKVEIINDKIHYRMKLGSDVFFDYHEALTMMNRMEEKDGNVETAARTLELLFEGPILPNYSFEWLDKFKADYSNAVISLLTHRLNSEMQKGNGSTALKIAETIMLHDPFSDKALATQCSILCRRQKKGIAKRVYDNFCKNYETCIGEKYPLSFVEVCK